MFPIILAVTILASIGIAFGWGGRDEKIAATMLMIGILLSNFVVSSGYYMHTESGLFSVDVATFGGLLILALRSDRFWPMWAAAFQLVAMLVHIGSEFQTGDLRWAYYIALTFWTFPVLITLGVGTWFEGRLREA